MLNLGLESIVIRAIVLKPVSIFTLKRENILYADEERSNQENILRIKSFDTKKQNLPKECIYVYDIFFLITSIYEEIIARILYRGYQ